MVLDPISLLPHRPPFRFVDRVLDLEPAVHCRATWTVTGDEPWLAGHFPGRPIVPGVLQLEALAQVGAIALLADDRFAETLPLFGGVEEVRWKRLVVPGDTIEMRVDVERLSVRGGWARGQASVDGELTVKARLLFVLAPTP